MSCEMCENMIVRTGWGPCHYFIIGLCAMCTIAEATASLMILITIPLLTCDFNYDKKDVMTFNAISSLGMACGSLLFGILADYKGRKCLIPMSMIVISSATVGLSFAQTYFTITLSIFVYGIGAAGNNSTIRLYLIECLPARKRGRFLATIDLIWMFGYTFALGTSWLLLPSAIKMLGDEFRPNSWRIFAGLAGAPNLIMACLASVLPPSPRYLIYQRRREQALIVLQHIFAINTSRHITNFPPINFDDCRVNDDNITNGSLANMFVHVLSKIWQRILFLFSFGLMEHTLLFILIRLFLFPGFIWAAIWGAHILTNNNICENSVSTNNQTCNANVVDMTVNFLSNCRGVNDTQIIYLFIFFTSFILGEIILAIGIDAVGRRLFLVMSGVVGATTILALTFTKDHYVKIILSVLSLASYSILNTATTIVQLEIYPTSVRGTVFGLTSILPHLVSCILKFSVQITSHKSLQIAFGLLIGTTIAVIPILDLTNAPMQE